MVTRFSFHPPGGEASTRDWGRVGEAIARRYLSRRGIELLAHNVQRRAGELDLVGREQGTLIVFEVKMRTSHTFGSPEESLTPRKLKRITKTAQYYCMKEGLDPDSFRIDLLAIDFDPQEGRGDIRHYRNVGA